MEKTNSFSTLLEYYSTNYIFIYAFDKPEGKLFEQKIFGTH